MRNKYGQRITENSVVRLRADVARRRAIRYRPITEVVGWLTDVPGGVVLREKLDGFYCWNVNDLELAGRHKNGKG
jgi:hypothetical protein